MEKRINLIGKKVVDSGGVEVGKILDVKVLPSVKKEIGVVVDPGFFRKGLPLSGEFIEKITDDAIYLNIIPSIRLNGMKVMNAFGREIGKVKNINRIGKTNNIESIVVGGIPTDIVVPVADIDIVNSDTIILKGAAGAGAPAAQPLKRALEALGDKKDVTAPAPPRATAVPTKERTVTPPKPMQAARRPTLEEEDYSPYDVETEEAFTSVHPEERYSETAGVPGLGVVSIGHCPKCNGYLNLRVSRTCPNCGYIVPKT
jgi:sporulation protein YlmC with PRC-barrel domain